MPKKQVVDEIGKIASKIARISRPEKIILFGSWAWGEPNSDSDVDLCVIKKTPDTRREGRDINRQLFPRNLPLDIIVYTPEYISERKNLGDFFVKNILDKGKTLYASV